MDDRELRTMSTSIQRHASTYVSTFVRQQWPICVDFQLNSRFDGAYHTRGSQLGPDVLGIKIEIDPDLSSIAGVGWKLGNVAASHAQ